MAKRQIVGQHFVGQDVPLSGIAYIDCTFRNCTLVFDGSPAHLDGCDVGTSAYQFDGAAMETITFLAQLWKAHGTTLVFEALFATIFADPALARHVAAMRHEPPPAFRD